MEHLIAICPDGSLQFIYDDGLRPLFKVGEPEIRRASHVEPTSDGRWQTDLSPIGGPRLLPTQQRATALAEEVKWIQENYIRDAPGRAQ